MKNGIYFKLAFDGIRKNRKLFLPQRSIGNVPQRKFSSKSCVSWALGT